MFEFHYLPIKLILLVECCVVCCIYYNLTWLCVLSCVCLGVGGVCERAFAWGTRRRRCCRRRWRQQPDWFTAGQPAFRYPPAFGSLRRLPRFILLAAAAGTFRWIMGCHSASSPLLAVFEALHFPTTAARESKRLDISIFDSHPAEFKHKRHIRVNKQWINGMNELIATQWAKM